MKPEPQLAPMSHKQTWVHWYQWWSTLTHHRTCYSAKVLICKKMSLSQSKTCESKSFSIQIWRMHWEQNHVAPPQPWIMLKSKRKWDILSLFSSEREMEKELQRARGSRCIRNVPNTNLFYYQFFFVWSYINLSQMLCCDCYLYYFNVHSSLGVENIYSISSRG